jgi:hypothetical protein
MFLAMNILATAKDKQRWFLMEAKALPRSKLREVDFIHIDISDRYLAELPLRNNSRSWQSESRIRWDYQDFQCRPIRS